MLGFSHQYVALHSIKFCMLPPRVHVMVGIGSPDPEQLNVAERPFTTLTSVGETSITGAPVIQTF